MYALLVIALIATISSSLANVSNKIDISQVKSCEGDLLLPVSMDFGPCSEIIGNRCVFKYGDAAKQHVSFKNHEHTHDFGLTVSSKINGNDCTNEISPENFKVNCEEGSCTLDHDFSIISKFPEGDHNVKFELNCKDAKHPAFCYVAEITIKA